MFKNMFSKVSFVLVVCMAISTSFVYAENNNKDLEMAKQIDEFLVKTGMSDDIVSQLDAYTKAYIYENEMKNGTDNKLTFKGFNKKFVRANKKTTSPDNPRISLYYISPADLSLTVISLVDSSGIYHIYPSFEWLVDSNSLANDSFAFALPNGWTLQPSSYNLNIYDRLNSNYDWNYVEGFQRPTTANFYGYAWKIPSRFSGGNCYTKGNAYFYAKPSGTPDKRLCISYMNDTTPFFNISYGYSWGPVSVSANTSNGDLEQTGEILGF